MEKPPNLSDNGETAINMPSELRIRQRLGQISIHNELSPQIEKLGGESMTAERLISRLTENLSTFAEKHLMGMDALAYGYMPKIIDALVDDASAKESVFDLWEATVKEWKDASADDISQVRNRYTQPKTKTPRKLKKAQQKSQRELAAQAYKLREDNKD
ncbi:MAG: hypothetical protein AAB462_02880 [Patescibacteria group bacterium]